LINFEESFLPLALPEKTNPWPMPETDLRSMASSSWHPGLTVQAACLFRCCNIVAICCNGAEGEVTTLTVAEKCFAACFADAFSCLMSCACTTLTALQCSYLFYFAINGDGFSDALISLLISCTFLRSIMPIKNSGLALDAQTSQYSW
jgi:hypothetical protein